MNHFENTYANWFYNHAFDFNFAFFAALRELLAIVQEFRVIKTWCRENAEPERDVLAFASVIRFFKDPLRFNGF